MRRPPTDPLAERLARVEEQLTAMGRLMETMFAAQDQKTTLALSSADKAVTKAEIATERRFEGVNEFRQTLSDQAAQFVTRREFESLRQAGTERMDELKEWVDRTSGERQGGRTKVGDQRAALAAYIGVATLVISIIIIAANIITSRHG